MLSIQDVIDYCDLERGEIEAIAEHEHIPMCIAAELSEALLVNPHSAEEVSDALRRALAMERPERQSLWAALAARADERADWRAARDFLAALFARVDLDPPHALLS